MTKQLQVIKTGEEVMYAQPSAKFFHKQTRHALQNFLQVIGMVHCEAIIYTFGIIQGFMICLVARCEDAIEAMEILQHETLILLI